MTLKSPWRSIQAVRRRHDLAYGGAAAAAAWTPALPTTDGGVSPDHWYRSDSGLWQDAGVTPAVLDGDVVGRWEDLTANADHVNQAVVGNKPTLQNGAGDLLNGHPVVRGDGANDYLQGAFTNGGAMAQPNTIFAVAALDAAAVNDNAANTICDGDDIANRHILGTRSIPNPDEWFIYAGSNLDGGVADSNWNIWTALFNGATSRFWHNGVAKCAAGAGGAQVIDGLTLFSQQQIAFHWNGDITEILIYDANLSDADKNQVGAYLATRYAIAYTDI